MKAGDLRDRIRLEQLSGGVWSAVAVLFASVLPNGTATAVVPADLPAPVTTAYNVRVRYRTDLSDAMRVRWDSETLAIGAVYDPDNRRRELVLDCARWVSSADLHAYALSAVAREGFAVTFSKAAVTHDAASDTVQAPTASTTTVAGYAKKLGGASVANDPGTLVETEAPVWLFVPTTIATLPARLAEVTANGTAFVAATIDPITVEGVTIAARITVER